MEVRATLRPGQKGTKKLLARFGERLLYVRYRYDSHRHKRFTTVELIVDEADWAVPDLRAPATAAEHPPVGIKVEMWESGVQRKVKAAGGTWDKIHRVWLLPLSRVRELGLEERIAAASGSKRSMLLETSL